MISNKITDSTNYFEDNNSKLILPSDFSDSNFIMSKEILDIVNKLNTLEYNPEKIFNIVDLDDTLYSRNPSLQLSILNENRWEAGNRIIQTNLWWYQEFCEQHYKKNQVVTEMIWLLKDDISIILTAGESELQNLKLKSIWYWFENLRKVVVDKDYKKPLNVLLYIIKNLGYIPGTINVYDDRVKFFNKYAPILSKLLQTQININYVELSQSNTNKLSHINQMVFDWKIINAA